MISDRILMMGLLGVGVMMSTVLRTESPQPLVVSVVAALVGLGVAGLGKDILSDLNVTSPVVRAGGAAAIFVFVFMAIIQTSVPGVWNPLTGR